MAERDETTDDAESPTTDDAESIESLASTFDPVLYKVLGELAEETGTGVLGRNTAPSGYAAGVTGTTASPVGYGLATPDDALIEGALSTTGEWLVTSNDVRLLVHTAEDPGGDGGNALAGHSSNSVGTGVVGATVAGGGFDDGVTSSPNVVFDDYGTISGGRENVVGIDDGDPTSARFGTVGGGEDNVASDFHATVGGGNSNTASGNETTVGGGERNVASGPNATVGGGYINESTATQTTVAGGRQNVADGSYDTIAGGVRNASQGYAAAIPGGSENSVTTNYGTVGGGQGNSVTRSHSTVGGGQSNGASGSHATVGGGFENTADGDYATVGGGEANTASGGYAGVGGGFGNSSTGDQSTVCGGLQNLAFGPRSFVGGGGGTTSGNEVFARSGAILGGYSNTIGDSADEYVGWAATIGGGYDNQNTGQYSTVGGGFQNVVNGNRSVVGGGNRNRAAGGHAMVPGGNNSEANGDSSFAAGTKAVASHEGAFVWSDSEFSTAESTGTDQFIVDAGGGTGIGTTAPESQLHVTDSIASNTGTPSGHVATIENTSTSTSADVLALKTNVSTPGGANNYVVFLAGDNTAVGAIDGTGTGGVNYKSGSADIAEYFPKADPGTTFEPGEVVGLDGGAVVADPVAGEIALVVSEAPMLSGNVPEEDREAEFVCLALVGQVSVAVSGPVEAGEVLVATQDGRAVPANEAERDSSLVVGRALAASDGGAVLALVGGHGLPAETGPVTSRLDALDTENDGLKAENDTLRAENESLRERLQTVESHLGIDSETPPTPADD